MAVNQIMSSFKKVPEVVQKDRAIIGFSMVPPFIGFVLYSVFGFWAFTSISSWGKEIIEGRLDGALGSVAYYAILIILSLILVFVVNWTFVLVVSFIAGPFNDIISERTEKALLGQTPEPPGQNLKRVFADYAKTMINEIKKISVIAVFAVIGLLFSLTTVLAPVSMVISAMLLAVQFLDYSWNRHRQDVGECISEVKGNFLPYIISGAGFTFLIAIPVINLLALPVAVIYFTCLWTQRTR